MDTTKRNSLFKIAISGLIFVLSLAILSFGALSIAKADATVTLTQVVGPTVPVGDKAKFIASATDADASGTIAYSINGAPSNASINPTTGVFLWDTTGAATGTYPFIVKATNVHIGTTTAVGSDQSNVTITVIAPQLQATSSTPDTGGSATTTGGIITTGGAVASTTVDNQLNQTNTNPDQVGSLNSSILSASSTNIGILGSSSTSTAATGDNTDTGGAGQNIIVTGNAISTANVINEVNTNIFNSNGLIIFLNQLFGGGINLNNYDLSYFLQGIPGASPTVNPITGKNQCTLLTCMNSSTTTVQDMNIATVTNSVIVRSTTGNNTASSSNNASIDTGDAYAAANVLNLVNTNIVNSSYLLLSFNNFGNLSQNITLPSAGFFSELFTHGSVAPQLNSSTYGIHDHNVATTTGSVTATAQTGDNIASTTSAFATASSTNATTTPTTGSGIVQTGNAYSSASTFNQNNTNNFGGTSVFMLFRVWGTFTGQIVGLPAGLIATTTPIGIEIISTNASTSPLATIGRFNSSMFLANATNTAAVQNNVSVSADTGNNTATSGTGTSSIVTGSAYSAASVVNLVNTNIVGQNWIFATFNIFGNFSGNISFGGGAPALALTAIPSTVAPDPGSTVTYTFTVTNSGDADAGNIILSTSFPSGLLTFTSGSTTGTGQSWNIGTVPADRLPHTFSYSAVVANVQPCQSISVPLTATVVNTDITSPTPSGTAQTSIGISSPAPASDCVVLPTSTGGGGGGGGGGISMPSQPSWTADPQITVVKTVDISTTTAPTAVNYKVVVSDPHSAGPAYNAILTDTLTDPSGATMYTRSWNLDTINPGDEIDLTYSVAYGTTTKPGLYRNSAVVTGQTQYNGNITKTLATGVGNVTFLPNGLVLGDSTSSIDIATSTMATSSISTISASSTEASCQPLLSNYLKQGAHTQDVVKLQSFLDVVGSNLPTTGYFGPMTTAAVKNFQITYANEILTPVGLTKPSGLVFSATLHKINQLACNGAEPVTMNNAVVTAAVAIVPTQNTAQISVVAKKAPVVIKPPVSKKPITLPKPLTVTTLQAPSTSKSFLGNLFKHLF
jgi:hypothetical protein